MVADLVRQAQGGDAEAYTELVRRFQDAVYATAYQIVLDADTARDIAQEAFVRAYQSLGRLRRPEAFPAWIVRICRNLATDWLRRPERHWLPLDETTRDEADVTSAVAARDLVSRALATLPEDNRLALSLFLVNGYTYQEVAALTGAPVSTVKGRIERAKGKLATEVLSMVEDGLKTNAPDEQFTLETVRESLKKGWEAAGKLDLAKGRSIAEEVLGSLAAAAPDEEAANLRMDALSLVVRSTFFQDPERWREAKRELIELAEMAHNDGVLASQLYDLALQDRSMPDEEREQTIVRSLGLFRKTGNKPMLGQALFFRGWHHIHDGKFDDGFAELQQARDVIKDEPYNSWQACLDASAEFERLTRRDLNKTRMVHWGAGCNTFKVEKTRLIFGGQPGFSCHTGVQAEMAKAAAPFSWLFHQIGWFPYLNVAPGFAEEKSGFSYTPNPTHDRSWIETDKASVSTPAGSFDNCLLLRATRTESPLDANGDHPQRRNNKIWCGEKWCWFARGVGPVAYRAERADGIIEQAVLSKFECPEQRDEWVPLVLGTRWEYVPAEQAQDFDTLMVEWLSHVDDEGLWYQPYTTVSNRRAKA
jgi:RNA polymerase sigma-70 factor, ECF subfamily